MRRVQVICEGPTEMAFVRELLQPRFEGRLHLIAFPPGKRFGHPRGGNISYDRVKPDILHALKQDSACFCTTFLDYYRRKRFPEKQEPSGPAPAQKAARIESAMAENIAHEMGPNFNPIRFRPYFSMHEFEGLLFSDSAQLAQGLYKPDLAAELQAIRDTFPTPEDINDDPLTAPSKRLIRLAPRYDKITGGNLAALAVGMDAIMAECEHFRKWIKWLESIQ